MHAYSVRQSSLMGGCDCLIFQQGCLQSQSLLGDWTLSTVCHIFYQIVLVLVSSRSLQERGRRHNAALSYSRFDDEGFWCGISKNDTTFKAIVESFHKGTYLQWNSIRSKNFPQRFPVCTVECFSEIYVVYNSEQWCFPFYALLNDVTEAKNLVYTPPSFLRSACSSFHLSLHLLFSTVFCKILVSEQKAMLFHFSVTYFRSPFCFGSLTMRALVQSFGMISLFQELMKKFWRGRNIPVYNI